MSAMRIRSVILACAMLAAGAFAQSAQATTVFSDNFDSYAEGTPAATSDFLGNWTVTQGSVDLIGLFSYDLYPGNGTYVDLNGSTGAVGGIARG